MWVAKSPQYMTLNLTDYLEMLIRLHGGHDLQELGRFVLWLLVIFQGQQAWGSTKRSQHIVCNLARGQNVDLLSLKETWGRSQPRLMLESVMMPLGCHSRNLNSCSIRVRCSTEKGCGMHHNKLKGMILSLWRDQDSYSEGHVVLNQKSLFPDETNGIVFQFHS